jgi:DNA (cytosine-5)-methyltransferase 1
MFRIICELRPRYVLVENVPGLLVRGMERVLGDLASIGYDAEWESLPASSFGASHLRERIFILAHAQQQLGFGGYFEDRVTYKARREASMGEFGRMACPETWLQAVTEYDRGDDGVPDRVDRLRGLGNAVVPQVAEWIGSRIMRPGGWDDDGCRDSDRR